MSATVENVTAAVEATNINDNSAADAAHAASAEEGRRLYIGNLAYATTEEDLKKFFSAYKVESTSIPTNPRTGRAVGYAFVDLATKEEAEKAIAELSGSDLVERKVSVQLARKPTAKTEENSNEEGDNAEGQGKRGRGGARGRGRARGRGGLKGRRGSGNKKEGSAEEAKKEGETGEAGQVLPLTETTNITPEKTTDAAAPAEKQEKQDKQDKQEKQEKKKAEPKEKAPRKKGPPENGVPSKTKVMVANLPYELSEEQLKELFAAYQPESAKIALRPIPPFMVRKLQQRGEPRKGRGFGFVTLANEEMQQKAVAEMNGKEVDGREIAVKVAIDNPAKEEEAAAKAEAAAAAAAAAAPDAATTPAPAAASKTDGDGDAEMQNGAEVKA